MRFKWQREKQLHAYLLQNSYSFWTACQWRKSPLQGVSGTGQN